MLEQDRISDAERLQLRVQHVQRFVTQLSSIDHVGVGVVEVALFSVAALDALLHDVEEAALLFG